MHSSDVDAARTYLHQIQPHDLATVMARIQYDLQMSLNTYASYVELLDMQLSIPEFPEVKAAKCRAELHRAIRIFQSIVNALPNYHDLQINDYDVFGHWKTAIGHDLRSIIGHFMGWADLVEFIINTDQADPSQAMLQLRQLHQTMQVTARRLRVITDACLLFNPSEILYGTWPRLNRCE